MRSISIAVLHDKWAIFYEPHDKRFVGICRDAGVDKEYAPSQRELERKIEKLEKADVLVMVIERYGWGIRKGVLVSRTKDKVRVRVEGRAFTIDDMWVYLFEPKLFEQFVTMKKEAEALERKWEKLEEKGTRIDRLGEIEKTLATIEKSGERQDD